MNVGLQPRYVTALPMLGFGIPNFTLLCQLPTLLHEQLLFINPLGWVSSLTKMSRSNPARFPTSRVHKTRFRLPIYERSSQQRIVQFLMTTATHPSMRSLQYILLIRTCLIPNSDLFILIWG